MPLIQPDPLTTPGSTCNSSYSAVITDMRLPDGNGLDLIQRLDASRRPERAIVITAYGSAENAVTALKAGAYDYLHQTGRPQTIQIGRAVGWMGGAEKAPAGLTARPVHTSPSARAPTGNALCRTDPTDWPEPSH